MSVARVLVAVGAALVLASFFGPATANGLGSAINGRHLADLLLEGTVAAWVPRWVGASLYLIPFASALALLGAGLDSHLGHVLMAVGAGLATTIFAIVTWALDGKPVTGPGWGSVLALLGIVAWGAALGTVLVARR